MSKPENLLYDDFAKFDLRSGMITYIEEIPKSKKLLRLEVDFGPAGKRTILAGIKGATLALGQRVVAVLNLAPRQMMGIESHGMLLATHDENNQIVLINPGPVLNGAEIG